MTKTDKLLSLILEDEGFRRRVEAQHRRHVGYGPGGACWEWTAQIDRAGYGCQMLTDGSLRSPVKAHRIAYVLSHKAMPPKDRPIICHHCDNPKCCNPFHLYAGTHRSNAKDKVGRGRLKIGTRTPEMRAKAAVKQRATLREKSHLSESDIEAIRASRLPQRELGKRYRISQPHVSRIKRREQRA